MDIRAANSIKKITDAFIEMRRKKPVESISVTSLCKIAGVNKSTFYAHFQDIYDLTDKIENMMVEEIVSSFDDPEDIMNGKKATEGLFKAYFEHSDMLNVVFSGSRSGFLAQKTEAGLKEAIFKLHPEYRSDLEMNVRLSIMIYGGFYAFSTNDSFDARRVIEIIGKFNNISS